LAQVLDTIFSPQDIKRLSPEQLPIIAEEIRQLLIGTISQTGGHLASNLGVVELTIALHRIFDSPTDKIIFDVGHQSYVHKILTGRRQRFETIRTFQGLSGFPRRDESPHDFFGTGHSSTSISAALGVALARDINHDKYNVVAVIGDGSLTGGLAYEGLNHAGHMKTKMTVILNDNEMSIARNVGAISGYLAKMRTTPTYSWVKHNIEFLLRRIPAIGEQVAATAERMKGSIKYLLVPGMLFEELGFTYLGPIDGHDLPLLLQVLETAKSLEGPVLVHVLTCKGKGYAPAECNADKYHGVGPFCVESGESLKNKQVPTYTSVFGDVMLEMAEQFPDLVAITAAMSDGTGLDKFACRFPERFFDVGIAEPHAVTLAAGMAANGKKPVVAIYSTFSQRAIDNMIHDVCLQNLPVILALDRAGLVGEDGPTHHGVFDLSLFRTIPNLTIMAPRNESELRNMLFTALSMNYPVMIRYPRATAHGEILTGDPALLLDGRSEWMAKGNGVVLMSVGTMAATCMEAAMLLRGKGIEAGIVNARYVKPIDEAVIAEILAASKTLVTVEENTLEGGFGTAVLEAANRLGYCTDKILCLGLPDRFIEHGSRSRLLAQNGLTPDGIAAKAAEFLIRTDHG